MKFKIFIAVFIFLFLVLVIGFFTEKKSDEEGESIGNEEIEDDGIDEDEGKDVESESVKSTDISDTTVKIATDTHLTTDADQQPVEIKHDADVDIQKVVDADSETADSDVDSDQSVACIPDETRYVPCDHVAGKLQMQVCNSKKVWEDERDCFEKPPVADMVSVSAASFWMGSKTTENNRKEDELRHFVQISHDYSVGKYEVTQGLFTAVMGYNPSHFKNCGKQCPVEMVSWHEAVKYANELSKIEHISPCFDCHGEGASVQCTLKKEYETPQECSGYRLPTEAEWEMAVRAGTNTAYYNKRESTGKGSDGSLSPIAWYANNSSVSYDGGVDCSDWFDGADKCGSQPHGKKAPNDFDLYDMSGNVAEWTMDFYQSTYPDGTESEPLMDPTGPEQGSSLVIRGGSWASLAGRCRSASRGQASAGSRTDQIGFRLAKSE